MKPPAHLRTALMVFAAAAVVAVVLAVAASRATIDAERHSRVVAAFDALAHTETSLDRDLLQVVAGLLPHYDTTVDHSHELRRLLAAFEAPDGGDLPAGLLDEYRGRIEAKQAAAENVKAVAAFVRHEISYLPFAVTRFAAAADPAAALRVQQALIAIESLGQGDGSSRTRAEIDALTAGFLASNDPELRGIGVHMRTLTEQQAMLHDAIRGYFAIASRAALEAARTRYMTAFAQRQEGTTWLVRLLQWTTGGLFAGLGWTISRLGVAHDAAQRARGQLVDAVTSLREGFALFDDSRRMVLSNLRYDRLLAKPVPAEDFDRMLAGMDTQGLATVSREPDVGADGHSALLQDRRDQRWYLLRTHRTSTGGTVCLFTDLTDDKRTEAELRKLTAAVEQSPIAILITDADAIIQYVNPRFLQLTGYTANEVIGKTPRLLKSGEVAQETYDEMWRTISAGMTWRGEIVNRKKNGDLFWENTTISPVRDAAGRISHFIALKEDVTLQKRNLDLLLDANADNERMLFAASHDLQEPVRSIRTYCQVLERQLPAEAGEEARESMAFIAEAARQISVQISGLTAFSRAGHPVAAFVPVDCRAAVDTAIADCRALPGGDQGARLAIGPLPTVLGDPVLLVMLFNNLVSNAIKFRRPDVPPEVTIGAERDGSGWRIDVADNGIGIEPRYLKGVVSPFSRLHPRAVYPGAGLGLASCDKIAKVHGGRMWLDSEPGAGTTIHVWLPSEST